MDQKSDKSKNTDKFFLKTGNGGTGDLLDSLSKDVRNAHPIATNKDTQNYVRHPSKHITNDNYNNAATMYARNNVGDMDDCFSQELIKSIELANRHDVFKSKNAIVMNHSIMDSKDIAAHFDSQENKDQDKEEELQSEQLFGNSQPSDRQLIQKEKPVSKLRRTITMTAQQRKKTKSSNFKSRVISHYEDDKSQQSSDEDKSSHLSIKNALRMKNTGATFTGFGIPIVNQNNEKSILKPNSRFINYQNVFQNLIKTTFVPTKAPIVSCELSKDSQQAILILKNSEFEFFVVMYDLGSQEITFKEKFGGKPHQYIKLNQVAQNEKGDYYSVCYFDDGKFRIRSFDGKNSRSARAIEEDEFDINAAIGINNHTMPNQGNDDPYISSVFTNDDKLFVMLFHNKSLTHHHFFYSIKDKQIIGKPFSYLLKDSSKENFPLSCFFNEHKSEIYSFYRQGLSFTIKYDDIHQVQVDQITDKDLGQMYLFDERALIVKSSAAILFFKRVQCEHNSKIVWKCYHQVEERGFVYYFPGNARINITTDEKIMFYIMDLDTLDPILENVIYNYMGCSQLLFGSSKSTMRYCIPYKQNRRNFDIYRTRYQHDLMCTLSYENLDKSLGVELRQQEQFLVTKVDKIVIYDSLSFEQKYTLHLDFPESETREINQIIGLQTSENEKYLAVIVGKILILNEQKLEYLYIFKLDENDDSIESRCKFMLKYKVQLTNINQFTEVTPCFYFKNKKQGLPMDTLIFSRYDQIFEFNFVNLAIEPIYKYTKELLRQPQYFATNSEQNVFLTASSADVIYLSLDDEEEIDIDELYNISSLSAVIFDAEDQSFLLLANGYQQQRGFYLLKVPQGQPYQAEWLMKQSNNLDIGDACVHIIRDQQRSLKELIVSYKQIYLNTYNVMIIDVGDLNSIIFKHESFLLWELKVAGIFLNRNQDFVIFSKQGMSVLALGNIEKRVMKNNRGGDILIHSLESYNYLKHDKSNCLMFHCSTDKNIISIEQEYLTGSGGENESQFEKIYSLEIGEITLRQALLFVSIYLSKTTHKIIELVCTQPDTSIFYTSLFELDGANMVSILSFESRSMQYLLSESFTKHFTADFPLFYKNKVQKGNIIQYEDISELNKKGLTCANKYFYRSAIDNALRNNQVRAIDLIIDYLVKYQNLYTSSFLFKKNMHLIFEKGIEVKSLLESKIFNMEFEYEEWPGIHVNNDTVRRPYNNSIFKLRTSYDCLFPEPCFQNISEDPDEIGKDEQKESKPSFNILTTDRSKIFKIKYTLNLLPVIGKHAITVEDDESSTNYGRPLFENEGISILEMCSQSDEINIFLSDCLQEVIQFKWNAFALKFHLVGLFMHCLYMLGLVLYIDLVYIHDSSRGVERPEDLDRDSEEYANRNNGYVLVLSLGILYPLAYESTSMRLDGAKSYFMQLWNYLDILLISFGILNVILHAALDPLQVPCKVCISMVVFLGMGKTFFYLRIFDSLSPIVTMLTNVFSDLKVFLMFFFILIFMFSMQISVTGLGNKKVPGPMRVNFYDPEYSELDPNVVHGEPYEEFRHLSQFIGNFLIVFRAAMGDFSMVFYATYLDEADNKMFWINFFLILVITNIVFLNFVIAEAGNSYNTVQEKLQQYILMEKAKLIDEAEGLIPDMFRKPEWYPKYIVVRKQAN